MWATAKLWYCTEGLCEVGESQDLKYFNCNGDNLWNLRSDLGLIILRDGAKPGPEVDRIFDEKKSETDVLGKENGFILFRRILWLLRDLSMISYHYMDKSM